MSGGASVGVVVASQVYPDAPQVGRELVGAEPSGASDDGDLLCFHAGTRHTGQGRYDTTGGRVVTMVGRGASLEDARVMAYRGLADVSLDGGRYRTDIAERELRVDDRAELSHRAG